MDKIFDLMSQATNWIWGIPILIVFFGSFLVMTILTKGVQFRRMKEILQGTFGSLLKQKGSGDGTVSSFAAAMTALAATVGASNILGASVAIAMGGPGAIFWMWVAALLGLGMKYSETVLGMKYRTTNADGEYVGGPFYYLEKGLNKPWVGKAYAIALVIFLAFSVPTQTCSVVDTAGTIGIPGFATAALMAVVVVLVIYGGIQRLSKVASAMVPFMAISYLLIAWIIIALNITELPAALVLICKSAFTPISAMGGFAGAGVMAGMRWGMARGIYSNEAGLGEFTIAHAAAITDHPCRQAQWAVFEVIVDTILILTTSALLVLVTGVWTEVTPDLASTAPTVAIQSLLGETLGSVFMTVMLFLFAFSTILVGIHYGGKAAEYLGGAKHGKRSMQIVTIVYIGMIFVAAAGKMTNFFFLADFFLAFVVFINVISVMIMHKQVTVEIDEFYDNPKYFPELEGKKKK